MELNLKLTEILAIYAACLSTIVLIWNIAKGIPRFRVDLMRGSQETEGGFDLGVYVLVKNPSAHTIHLSNISMLYPYGIVGIKDKLIYLFKYRRFPNNVGWVSTNLSNYEINDKCPIALESGQSHDVFIPESVLENILSDCTERKFKAVVQDQLSRNKYSSELNYPKTLKAKK